MNSSVCLLRNGIGALWAQLLTISPVSVTNRLAMTSRFFCTRRVAKSMRSLARNEKAAAAAGIDYSVWTEEFKDNDRSLAEGEKVGKIKMILDAKEKPIGVQILGLHAGELLNEWVAVLNGKVKLSTLAAAVHPYPTLGEVNKRVAGTFFSPKIFSDRVKKGLKLFFNLKGRACD